MENLYTSFEQLGYQKAEEDLNRLDDVRAQAEALMKPFTTKVPSYVLESIDLVANKMGIPRNTLVSLLISQFLGQAFFQFVVGYDKPFSKPEDYSEAAHAKSELEKLFESESISEEAKEFLDVLLHNFLVKNKVQ